MAVEEWKRPSAGARHNLRVAQGDASDGASSLLVAQVDSPTDQKQALFQPLSLVALSARCFWRLPRDRAVDELCRYVITITRRQDGSNKKSSAAKNAGDENSSVAHNSEQLAADERKQGSDESASIVDNAMLGTQQASTTRPPAASPPAASPPAASRDIIHGVPAEQHMCRE